MLRYNDERLCKECFSKAIREANDALGVSAREIEYKIQLMKHCGLLVPPKFYKMLPDKKGE